MKNSKKERPDDMSPNWQKYKALGHLPLTMCLGGEIGTFGVKFPSPHLSKT